MPYLGVSIRCNAMSRVIRISEQSPGLVMIITVLGFSHLTRVLPLLFDELKKRRRRVYY